VVGGSVTGGSVTGGSVTGGSVTGGSVTGGSVTGDGSVVGGLVSGGVPSAVGAWFPLGWVDDVFDPEPPEGEITSTGRLVVVVAPFLDDVLAFGACVVVVASAA
jgi:hypothetical protein